MQTVAERLQFIIRFAQMDLDALRPGDWLNLRDDLTAFLSMAGPSAGIVIPYVYPPGPQDFPEAGFRALQAAVLDVLRCLLDNRAGISDAIPIRIHAFYILVGAPSPPLPGEPPMDHNVLGMTGTTWDCCMLVLLHLLARERTNQIVRCPECRTIFYRVGKQKYCSRTCSNRTNVRAWRQQEQVKQVEADRARARYATKKKPARVTPRPRKGVQPMPKRRANHEGTIYKRQDGRWVASVTLPGGKRKSFYGRTRQEVAQKLIVGLKARQDGIPLPSEQLKVRAIPPGLVTDYKVPHTPQLVGPV